MRSLLIAFVFFAWFVALMVLTISNQESSDVKTEEEPHWQPVSNAIIGNYFNKNNKEALQVCETNKKKVFDKEDGYVLERYTMALIHRVNVEPKYKWTHDGDYIQVGLYCDYTVDFILPPFTSGTENIEVFAGTYRMKKHYNLETKKLTYLSFE